MPNVDSKGLSPDLSDAVVLEWRAAPCVDPAWCDSGEKLLKILIIGPEITIQGILGNIFQFFLDDNVANLV